MDQSSNEIWEALSRQLDLPAEALQASCQSAGGEQALLRQLDSDRAQQVESILSDPAKTKALLDSPQAQALLRRLGQQE